MTLSRCITTRPKARDGRSSRKQEPLANRAKKAARHAAQELRSDSLISGGLGPNVEGIRGRLALPDLHTSEASNSKFEKGKVGFQTHAPTYRSELWRHIQLICMDCCAVVKGMNWELTKGLGVTVPATFDCITPEQLRDIMTARPYSPPLIDQIKAKALVEDYMNKSS